MPSPAYRAMPGYASSATFTDSTGRTLAIEFSVTEFCWLSTIWFYRPTTAVALPVGDVAGVWTVTAGASESTTTGALVAGTTGSGAVAWVATTDQVGWIPGVLANPVLLAPGLIFRAGVWNKGTLPGLGNYWSTGAGASGLASGPLRMPSSATAVNGAQSVYSAGAARAFPSTASPSKANVGIDVTVEPDPDLIQGVNECANPAGALDAAGWTGYPSLARVSGLSTMAKPTGLRVTVGTSATYVDLWGTQLPVAAGEVITARLQVDVSVAASVRPGALFFDASGALIASATLRGNYVAISASTPSTFIYTFTVPSGVSSTAVVVEPSAKLPAGATMTGTALRYRRGSWPSLGFLDGDSPKWVWDGVAGKSTSRRNPKVWAADTDSSAAATVGTAIGYTGTQRQDGSGTFVSGPAAIPVEAAPFGRPGRASRIDIPTGYQRIEQNPQHREFASGEEYWFGFAFALAAGHPTWVDDYWVIEQLHAAPGQGSPVLGFEVRNYSLRLRGGDNRPVAGGGSSGSTYAYNQLILPNLRVNRFYDVRYRVLFSDQPGGGSIDAYVDGQPRLLGFAPPCGTVYGPDTSSTEYGNTYRKQGAYKRPTLEGGTVWHAGAALGTSFDAVNPARTQLVVTSETMASAYC